MKKSQSLQLIIAKCIVQTIFYLSKLLHFGEGSNFPGRVGLMLFPDLFRMLVPKFKKGWIVVTGTNGKTTTTKILVAMMEKMGHHVVTNARGANLITGITTSILMTKAPITQDYIADYAVFEIDEAVLGKSFTTIQPGILVVTNFSRDQLDRYGEVDSNVNKILNLLKAASFQCKVILNGNDPNIARIGSAVKPEERLYFGIKSEIASPETGLLIEKDTGTGLEPGMETPDLDIWADQIEAYYLNGSKFTLGYHTTKVEVALRLPGVFNILNALAASAVAFMLQADPKVICAVLSEVEASYGRSEHFKYQNSSVFLFLVKNPVGFNHIIQLISQASAKKRVLFLLNDLTADGKDVSWIWDVALENMWKVTGIQEIMTSGTRAGDMALRVKYSNPPEIPLTVDYSPQHAFRELASRLTEGEEIFILANYTAMNLFRPFLLKVADKS